ncbi:hypothetical protein [Sodalis-like endosymbiont of Proechinophthirus fluctus]|uniref:hypothetical protein n=1 Tax=Sodalis-like endosymbiont of Proechinophthirus fluctus TaxID=1462730 RepID=UPI000A7DE37E
MLSAAPFDHHPLPGSGHGHSRGTYRALTNGEPLPEVTNMFNSTLVRLRSVTLPASERLYDVVDIY